MKTKERGGVNLAFIDVLFNMVICFCFLFIMSFVFMNPKKKEESGVQLKAEIMITMTWPDNAGDDIDLWLKQPDGKIVFFRNKETEYCQLDRDDLGTTNDIYIDENGKPQLIRINREIITIRALVPGSYVVAGFVFKQNLEHNADTDVVLPYKVTFSMVKINPVVEEVIKREVTFSQKNEEHTAFTFDIGNDRTIQNVRVDNEVPIVRERLIQQTNNVQ